MAFNAVWGIDGSCDPGGQGICWPHVFVMDADGTNVRQITFNPPNASMYGGDNCGDAQSLSCETSRNGELYCETAGR
jgi:hypothetical protein